MSTWNLREHEAIAVLTFTRPSRNEMDFASMRELTCHLQALAERSDQINAVLLTGGEEGFFVRTMQPRTPRSTRRPVPGAGATVRLARLIGHAKATELILTGRTVDAQEALALGWLNHILPTHQFLQAAIDWATRLTRSEPTALYAAKRALHQAAHTDATTALATERDLFAHLASHSQKLRTLISTSDPAHRHNIRPAVPEGPSKESLPSRYVPRRQRREQISPGT